ncbi:MAG: FAD-binding oxidoreductase [Pseudomonadota bacterium]|nr:FAD-binding oxidoreductase [Pseudomonadota bacterium]
MLVRRRTLLTTGSAALLTGCATLPTRRGAAGCSPLPAVQVDESRVIRTVAGLRPYRASGFVVRREQLGDKVLVHNYGHGGAGITLSWGSSRLATTLGLQGHSGPVAVVGAGIMGLTTARLVQEAGLEAIVYAKELPPHTTSNVAGGQIAPFGHYDEQSVTPEWRQQFLAAMDYSWRRFQIMIGDDYGIRWLPTYEETSRTALEPGPLTPYSPNLRLLSQSEHPFPVERMLSLDAMYVETGRYLRQMMRDFQTAGGKLQRREFADTHAIASLSESLVFNCTGIGARALFGDEEMIPVRGQLAVLLPQPEIRYAASGRWGYMFPRADGILLGGTFERDVWDTTPDARSIRRIVASHKRFFEGLRCSA